MKRIFAGFFALILVFSALLPALPAAAEETAVKAADAPATVGAIRWDAWYGHGGGASSVISQVEKSLSPAKYHFRAPFFARVTEEGGIEIPEYTQEIFDREMEYAIDAGIDYFAYLWYSSEMKKAREFHIASKYRDQVKMCACLDGNAIGQSYARKELETLWPQDCYMKIDGRPLMYFYGTKDNLEQVTADIAYYKKLAQKLGMAEPYVVLMNKSSYDVRTSGADALSCYATSLKGGVPFANLAKAAEDKWEEWRLTATQIVPAVTFGWHTGTRYDTPVSWTTVSEDSWVEYATKEELTQHLKNALLYLQRAEVKVFAKANTVLIYAWNEHDEGGWICPTIAVDENGNQLFDENGAALVNDDHLQAVKAAVSAVRNGETEATPTPGAAGEPADATPAPETGLSTADIIWIVCGTVVVLACAAAIAMMWIRAKKGEK